MTGPLLRSPRGPLRGRDDLVGFFQRAGKPRSVWRVGVEFERLGVDRATGRAIPYYGPCGVEAVLRGLSDRFGWKADEEDGHVVAMQREEDWVTLEPGGQIELSARPLLHLSAVRESLDVHCRELQEVSAPLGVAWLGLGLHPISGLDETPWVPKARYRIMGPFLGNRGRLAHWMMKQTAAMQLNFDYTDEADAVMKLRTAMALSPLSTALFANSPLREGKPNGYRSYRSHIWDYTDPDRCGLLPEIFRPDYGFADYVDYALGVPMMFVVRDGEWISMGGIPFRQFLEEGWHGLQATWKDWILHLTALFPEVRLKGHLEVRSIDGLPPSLAMSPPALWKGLMYDEQACRAAWELVADLTWDERLRMREEGARLGLAATIRGRLLKDLALEVIELARAGLIRQAQDGLAEPGEEQHLEPIEELVANEGICPADRLLRLWEEVWRGDPGALADFAGCPQVEATP